MRVHTQIPISNHSGVLWEFGRVTSGWVWHWVCAWNTVEDHRHAMLGKVPCELPRTQSPSVNGCLALSLSLYKHSPCTYSNSPLGVVFLLGQAIGREKAFCSHPDVVRTLANPPTPFCSLSGSKPHSCKFTCTHKCALAYDHTHAMSCTHRLTHINTHYYAFNCT